MNERIKEYSVGYVLIHPDTKERVAIFQGYSDIGSEVWLTVNGIEHCNFESFSKDGWTRWIQSVKHFSNAVSECIGVE